MSDYLQGYFGTQRATVEARNDITVVVRNWFANRNPLVTRLPYVDVGTPVFQMYTHKFRPTTATLSASISTTTVTALTLADTSFLMNHDLLEIVDSTTGSSEIVQVNGDPVSSTVVNVIRGVSSTTAAATGAGDSVSVYLIGNSRTGSEIDQAGLSSIGVARTQYTQTFQFSVQVGGGAQSTTAQVFPSGIQTPFDMNKMTQLQNMIDSLELACFYGKAEAPSQDNATTAKMNGLRYILATNNTASPVGASAYTPDDLIRDAIQTCRTNGGDPDLMLVSTSFMSGLAKWGQPLVRLDAGATRFGVKLGAFEAPFLNGITIVEAPLLRDGTAVTLTSSEVYIRPKRRPFWNPRANRGDMIEGEWICEAAIEVANESHHSFVSGITGFSAS